MMRVLRFSHDYLLNVGGLMVNVRGLNRELARCGIEVDHAFLIGQDDMSTILQSASEYLLGSLLAFQNLEEDLKQQLRAAFDGYEKKVLPEDMKYLAMGFVFLTLVGEAHFETVLQNAVQVRLGRS